MGENGIKMGVFGRRMGEYGSKMVVNGRSRAIVYEKSGRIDTPNRGENGVKMVLAFFFSERVRYVCLFAELLEIWSHRRLLYAVLQ